MLLQTSRQAGSIPLVLVLGECAADTRRVVNALITQQSFTNAVVIRVKQEAPEPLHHSRVVELPRLEVSAQDGCLCCGMHGALGDALRQIFFEALHDRSKSLDRVLIESNSIESVQLAHTLKHTPFLGQRYFHQITFRVLTTTLVLDASTLCAEAWHDQLAKLKGLDPVHNASQQILIISPLQMRLTPEQFDEWSAQIKREFTYEEVFYLSAQGNFGPNTLQKALGLGSKQN